MYVSLYVIPSLYEGFAFVQDRRSWPLSNQSLHNLIHILQWSCFEIQQKQLATALGAYHSPKKSWYLPEITSLHVSIYVRTKQRKEVKCKWRKRGKLAIQLLKQTTLTYICIFTNFKLNMYNVCKDMTCVHMYVKQISRVIA